jgi:hypothetical protein
MRIHRFGRFVDARPAWRLLADLRSIAPLASRNDESRQRNRKQEP